MANWFRLWEKKRGGRRTGSPLWASLGEGAFFGAMFLAGALALGAVAAASWLQLAEAELYLAGWTLWFVVAVLAALAVIGASGLLYTWLRAGTSLERRAALAHEAARFSQVEEEPGPEEQTLPGVPHDEHVTDSPGIALAYRLPIAEQPGWRIVPAGIFCGLWNLATAILVGSWLSVGGGGMFTIVVIGFAAVGAWSIYNLLVEMSLASELGPTALEISDHPLLPGRSYEFYLSQTGRQRLAALEVLLVCEEETTYSQGTDVRTEVRRVHEQWLHRSERVELKPGQAFEAQGSFTAPDEAMHSFQSEHNLVQWKLLVRGIGADRPAWERYFSLVLHPAPPLASV